MTLSALWVVSIEKSLLNIKIIIMVPVWTIYPDLAWEKVHVDIRITGMAYSMGVTAQT